jgi:hypothetical protein
MEAYHKYLLEYIRILQGYKMNQGNATCFHMLYINFLLE